MDGVLCRDRPCLQINICPCPNAGVCCTSHLYMSTEDMPPLKLTISAARQKFFDLFESVTTHRGRKVVISSRGVAHHAVLVGEAYLNELEAAAKKLRDLESGKASTASDFRLIGSGRVEAGAGDAITDIRGAQNVLWEKKLASFGK